MAKKYLLAERTIDQADLAELTAWIQENPWLTQGPMVKEFERQWAQWTGHRHATFVNSGSSANLLMYASLLESGRLKNKKVIVPAVSWVTTVAPAIQLGFEPIMCDADDKTLGLDQKMLAELCEEHKPAAVILVHVLGVPNDMKPLMELKQKHGFILMEDSCAATGSRYAGKMCGRFGELASYSFYFGHHLSTIEGGMVCTDDEKLHKLMLHLRSHGWAKDLPPDEAHAMARENGVRPFNETFTFYYAGYNFRSTDLNARIGLTQIKKADRVVGRRAENHRMYQERFLASPDFLCQTCPDSAISSISFCALAKSPEHRDRVGEAMRAAQIETRPIGGGNMSRQPFWRNRYGATVFPTADRLHDTGFQLPNHPDLSLDDVKFICDTVLAVRG